jgi:DNA-binding transcriptional MocR family regulator
MKLYLRFTGQLYLPQTAAVCYNQDMNTYEQVVERMVNLMENGVFKQGEKLPSLRELSKQLHVSVNTIREAYWKLEDRNFIEAVPQSGYYVRPSWVPSSAGGAPDPSEMNPREVSLCRIYGTYQDGECCPPGISLGIATMPRVAWPLERLGKDLQEAIRTSPDTVFDYQMPPGYLPLREQIARLAMASGTTLSPDEIIITNGCHEAVFLSLMAVCRPGDKVAIESPIYFNFLSLLERLGYETVEIPSSESEGINIEVLEYLLENEKIGAVFAIPNFSNPMGSLLSNERKKRLVALTARYKVPLIEDDIYGDLGFGDRPSTCRGFDTEGLVIHCSSFSKTIAPGLRIGWVAPGKHYDEIVRLKTLLNLGAPALLQVALARFLKEGGYERHLRNLRKDIRDSLAATRKALLEHLPEGTTVTDPAGGFVLWVTLPEGSNAMELYYRALKEGILIAPGPLFTRKEKHARSFRINGSRWCPETEAAVMTLGRLCKS